LACIDYFVIKLCPRILDFFGQDVALRRCHEADDRCFYRHYRQQARRYSVLEDEKFLRNVAHEFEEGFNSGDVDRIMRFYGDTYVDVNLRDSVQTKAERREYYAQVMARPGIHLNVRPDDVLIRGDLAFVRGTILLTQDAGRGGETTQTELRYLEICERAQDGTWRVVWGMDGPVQEYVAGSQESSGTVEQQA
jgi:ketosteroid isomerase-like protein